MCYINMQTSRICYSQFYLHSDGWALQGTHNNQQYQLEGGDDIYCGGGGGGQLEVGQGGGAMVALCGYQLRW